MREILSKAKRIDNGEWVEGYYCGYSQIHGYCMYIRESIENINCEGCSGIAEMFVEVDPKTVSQKLTIKLANGEMFFDGWEGDRIRAYSIFANTPLEELTVKEQYTEGVLKWSVNCFSLVTDNDVYIDGWVNAEKVEIIGNIHQEEK